MNLNRLFIGLILLLSSCIALAQIRVGVMTMQPGEVFWERFGHNAIVIDRDDGKEATSYNFGMFNINEAGFVPRFIRGQMRYLLAEMSIGDDLYWYQVSGRGVSIQWLNLTQQQAQDLAAALSDNAKAENAYYDYRYFTDNCSTRVRDALDRVLEGQLKRTLSGRSRGNTYRSESVRLAWPEWWMGFGFHIGISGKGDQALSRWDEAFIPMQLADSLNEVRLNNGQALVSSQQEILPHKISLPPTELPRWRVHALIIGLFFSITILYFGKRSPRSIAVFANLFWLAISLLGNALLAMWLFTTHNFSHGNENLLLFNPLAILLLYGGLRAGLGKQCSRIFYHILTIVLVCAGIAAFLKLLPFAKQQNLEWILLLLPIHWALARHFHIQSGVSANR